MLQSYLVTEKDNKRLNSNKEVFQWLVTVFDHAISGKPWHHCKFAVIEVIKVRLCFNAFHYRGLKLHMLQQNHNVLVDRHIFLL